jgi:hypothetical protein
MTTTTDSSTPQQAPSNPVSPSEEAVDKTRAWTGLYAVVGGDIAIAVGAVIALFKFASSNAVLPAILSSAFAAISTMTTAYFGIRESSNTAQRSVQHQAASSAEGRGLQ